MCLMCIELTKRSMTVEEVGRALNEFNPKDEEHWEDIAKVLKENYNEQDIIEQFWKEYIKRI